MSSPTHDHKPRLNYILTSLRADERERLLARSQQIEVSSGETIYEAGTEIDAVYFPESAVFSLHTTMQNGDTVEVGPAGYEGLVGLHVFLGTPVSPDRIVVHVPGTAWRVPADDLRLELRRGGELTRRLLSYTRLLLVMMSRTSACYKHHPVPQQIARWLLLMHDYAEGDELRLTHDLIARTLGVRRSGVTIIAGQFQDAGMINYTRGLIRVTDRSALEQTACECYGVIRAEFDRLRGERG